MSKQFKDIIREYGNIQDVYPSDNYRKEYITTMIFGSGVVKADKLHFAKENQYSQKDCNKNRFLIIALPNPHSIYKGVAACLSANGGKRNLRDIRRCNMIYKKLCELVPLFKHVRYECSQFTTDSHDDTIIHFNDEDIKKIFGYNFSYLLNNYNTATSSTSRSEWHWCKSTMLYVHKYNYKTNFTNLLIVHKNNMLYCAIPPTLTGFIKEK